MLQVVDVQMCRVDYVGRKGCGWIRNSWTRTRLVANKQPSTAFASLARAPRYMMEDPKKIEREVGNNDGVNNADTFLLGFSHIQIIILWRKFPVVPYLGGV